MPMKLETGVVLDDSSCKWFKFPKRLGPSSFKKWAERTGGDQEALDFPIDVIKDYRRSAEQICGGRWRLIELMSGPDSPVLVWLFLMHSELKPGQREQAFEELVTWSGLRVDGVEEGEGFTGLLGDSHGTMDFGLEYAELRHYPASGVVAFFASSEQAALDRVAASITLGERAPSTAPPPPARPDDLEAMLASPQDTPGLGDCPGPSWQVLQRLACALDDPYLDFGVDLKDGGALDLTIIGGADQPFWMPGFDGDPPGGGYLVEILDGIAEWLGTRKIRRVSAKLKRPRGGKKASVAAAACLESALEELRPKVKQGRAD